MPEIKQVVKEKYGQAAPQYIDNNNAEWRQKRRDLAKELLV